MGAKLALEVDEYIKENCLENAFFHLSFIGYSLGGIIIRAALPILGKYKKNLKTYMTLSTPHLGLIKSGIVSAGLWIFKKWNGSKALA